VVQASAIPKGNIALFIVVLLRKGIIISSVIRLEEWHMDVPFTELGM